MGCLLLHRRVLGQVNEVSADHLRIRFHVNCLHGRKVRTSLIRARRPRPLRRRIPDLLQSGGGHASHALEQRQLWEVLQQPLVPRQELSVHRVFFHALVLLLSVFQGSFSQNQRQALHTGNTIVKELSPQAAKTTSLTFTANTLDAT